MAQDQIVVLDEQKMLEKIMDFPNQLEKAWTSYWIKDLGLDKSSISHVILVGMGGSGIAGALAAELAGSQANMTVTTWNDYQLPAFADNRTLVVAISYSGNTEETIDALRAAHQKNIPAICITSGGKLKEVAAIGANKVLEIDYQAPPRAALGWLFGAVLTILGKLEIAPVTEKYFFDALEALKKVVSQNTFKEKAQKLAIELNNKIPLIVAYQPLTSLAKRFANQINENAKTFAVAACLPEANHNLIVGLDYPSPEKLVVLSVESKFGFSRNAARSKVLTKLMREKEISHIPLLVNSANPLAEQLLFLHFADLVSYYLAGVYGVDPTPIEVVDKLKKELEKL